MEQRKKPKKSKFALEMEEKTRTYSEFIKQINPSYDDLLKMAASSWATCGELEQLNSELTELCNDYATNLRIFSKNIGSNSFQLNVAMLEMMAEAKSVAATSLLAGMNLSKKLQAQKGAKQRHVETHSLRNEIIEYWKSDIDIKLSSDKAADELIKQFPLSHRKLSEYVAAEKKLLRASRA